MADTTDFIDDLAALPTGQWVEAWSDGALRHHGIVEEKLPELGVLWIREIGTGERRMLDLIGYDVCLR